MEKRETFSKPWLINVYDFDTAHTTHETMFIMITSDANKFAVEYYINKYVLIYTVKPQP